MNDSRSFDISASMLSLNKHLNPQETDDSIA